VNVMLWLGWVSFVCITFGIILTAIEHYDRKHK
jgi:hypothetical protein